MPQEVNVFFFLDTTKISTNESSLTRSESDFEKQVSEIQKKSYKLGFKISIWLEKWQVHFFS